MSWCTARVRKAEIDGQTVLFSEETQALVALNDGAAELWRRLEAGQPLGDSCDPHQSGAAAEVLAEWARTGLIRPSAKVASDADDASASGRCGRSLLSRNFAIGSVAVRLNVSPALSADVWPYLAQLPDCHRDPQVVLSIRETDRPVKGKKAEASSSSNDPQSGAFELRRGRRLVRRCARDEVVPAIKLQLIADVLEHGSQVLALHAAALIVDGCFLLVAGPSGAGKSTLAAALLAVGHGFAADDVVLLNADGAACGVPVWPALKEGAWPLLNGELGMPGSDQVHRRPDGKAVRYMPPGPQVTGARHPVGYIVVLSDRDGATCRVTAIDRMDALAALLAGASAPGDKLSEEAFAALAILVRNARCYALSRGPVSEAVAAVTRACREPIE